MRQPTRTLNKIQFKLPGSVVHIGLGNQKDEKVNWSSCIGWFMLKGKGKVLFLVCNAIHTCTWLTTWIECWRTSFPYKVCILLLIEVIGCEQIYIVCGNILGGFTAVACFFDKGERYIEEKEKANWVSREISDSEELLPEQRGFLSPCIFSEKNLWLRRVGKYCNQSRANQTDFYSTTKKKERLVPLW